MVAEAGASDLGRYRLGRLLGRGGMGEVYLAHDQTLDRDVAIKFVAADKAGDEVAGRRLLHEAHAAAALDHPGICTVYETGQTPDGHAFIVMQYVEGQPLSTLLQAGLMPVRDALALATRIAEALGAAHRRSIVHRDLKPSNVMVTLSGRPKLLDFGIAKQVVLPPGAVDAPTSSADFTTAGTIVGTPAYMSPEQIQQRPLDGRSDLFSLGVVLFECLTGRRAFEGPSTLETIANVLHLHPPAPSSLRRELTDRHDELCRRLMAKDASDRFQSAEEVVGAIRLLLPDTSRTEVSSGHFASPTRRPELRVSHRVLIAASAVAIVAIVGFTIWRRPAALPTAPPEADRWYQRGLDAMYEGAYDTGRRAFEQAVAVFPQHVLAYARLADANAELDNDGAAKEHLLRVSQLVPDESRLPEVERLRAQAIRASVLRELDTAIAIYRELVNKQPNHASAWLDMGRAQEAAGLRTDARDSYARAIAEDGQNAAAYLRLGHVEGLESRRTEALAALAEAGRLYSAASDDEGETEVLLRRGAIQEAAGEFRAARTDLERAIELATRRPSLFQQVRAKLLLSRVTASAGQFTESERIAKAAVNEARENGLDMVAADGLIDLAATLQQMNRPQEAEGHARKAIELAEQRGARRTTARARLQLASWQASEGRPNEALTLVGSVLPFVKANRYRRMESDALQIASRAHQSLDQLDTARRMATDVLALAEAVKDQSSVALASTNLASVATALGDYPEAIRLRARAESIHRQQGDDASLPYDLANRADLLIRLGRPEEAEVALAEVDAGSATGVAAYVGRARRVVFLRALASVTALRCADAFAHLATVKWDDGSTDSASVMAPGLAEYCAARLRRPKLRALAMAEAGPGLKRELAYWVASAALERGDGRAALATATDGLNLLVGVAFDELRWRLAAVGAAAAADLGNRAAHSEMSATATKALDRVKSQWKTEFEKYGKRADVVYLLRRAGLS